MDCPKCGEKNPEGYKFCPICGTALVRDNEISEENLSFTQSKETESYDYNFSNKFRDSEKRNKTKEIIINTPKICPVCGSSESFREYTLYSKWGGKEYIKVFMCKEHFRLKQNTKYINRFSYVIFLSIILLISIEFLVGIRDSTFLDEIIVGLIFLLDFLYLIKSIKRGKIIDDHIRFQYFDDRSLISIKRDDWAKKFRELNQYNNENFILRLKAIFDKKEKRNWIIIGIFIILGTTLTLVFYIQNEALGESINILFAGILGILLLKQISNYIIIEYLEGKFKKL